MQQPTPLRRGLMAVGVLLVMVGGTAFVLMLVVGLPEFLGQLQESPGAAGVLWACVALGIELVVPALLVWIGIRCVGQGEQHRETS